MRPSVKAQKESADDAWERVVWPSMRAIGWWGPAPVCMAADAQDNDLGRMLDFLCGVDKVIKPNGYGLLYGLRIHFVRPYSPYKTRAWLTIRYRTKKGRTTEFDKLPHQSGRLFQAYVAMARSTVTRAFDVSAQAVLEAIRSRDLDLQEVQGGNVMARCHLSWLLEDGADVRDYQSIVECHRVNAPNVHNLIRHYGASGRSAYSPPEAP